ncbi:MAG: T9SS type A sorting domain-containing protein, partial [Bacteroidota bacterium]
GYELSLPAGWSIMPVWSMEAVSSNDIFEQIADEFIIAYSIDYNEVYWNIGGINSLKFLIPGKAYMLKLSAPATISFDVPTYDNAVSHEPEFINNTNWPDANYHGTVHSISVSAQALSSLQEGDVIGVFNANGLVAGMAQIRDKTQNLYLRVNADDPMTDKVDGLLNGDEMHFKVFRPATGKEFTIYPEFNTELPNAGNFETLGMSMISKLKQQTVSIGDVEAGACDLQMFPNPASDQVHLKASATMNSVQVLNLTGQVLINNELKSDEYRFDVSGLHAGTYFIRVKLDHGHIISKQLLIQ